MLGNLNYAKKTQLDRSQHGVSNRFFSAAKQTRAHNSKKSITATTVNRNQKQINSNNNRNRDR